MSIDEIKKLIHKLVEETNAPKVLSQILEFFNIIKFKNKASWDNISPQEQQFIDFGIQQIKDGLGISHEEVRKEINQILHKKINP